MDPYVTQRINRIWGPIYPPLARFVADIYGRTEGDYLELGPFSGGITREILPLLPGLRAMVAIESPELRHALSNEIEDTPLARRIIIDLSPFVPLAFIDASYDLVVFRGAFFFLTPPLLMEIYRVLRPGGVAIVGGGYGPATPSELINEIAEESKQLNLQLGKQWLSEAELKQMLEQASLSKEAEIIREGGLWVILRKKGNHDQEQPGLAAALALRDCEVISFVGAGGKTTLMFALARELTGQGRTVITTATTKISEPSVTETPCVIIEADEGKAEALLKDGLLSHGHCTFAPQRFAGKKIGGTDPAFIERLAQGKTADYIIVEADGARGLPVKAPAEHEPVIPAATTVVIPVAGIDALGRPLSEETAFRPELIAELTKTRLGEPLTTAMMAMLIVHRQGLVKGVPAEARIIVVINKVETRERLSGARKVGDEVLYKGGRQIERIVLGRAFFQRPIVEIIERRSGSEPAV
jgi:probable selenium-dependent hydroxylase accessory protein YqeC